LGASSIAPLPDVLVVDDEPAVLEVCERALRAFGCTPLLASNAAEALAIARASSRPIPAAIIDIVLPDMGGLELVRILRDAGLLCQVVCISGFPLGYIPEPYRGSLENCFFLQKPFTAKQLRAILMEACGTLFEA